MQGLGFNSQHHYSKVNEESKDLFEGLVEHASNPRPQEAKRNTISWSQPIGAVS